MIGHHHLALHTAWYCTSGVTIERQVIVKEVSWTFSMSCVLEILGLTTISALVMTYYSFPESL